MANGLFKSGDSVVYPGHGVGIVGDVKAETIGSLTIDVLTVTFENGMTLRVPTANLKKCGLRKVATRQVMRDVFAVLSTAAPSRKKAMWRHRALEYAAKIKTGDAVAIAEIVRDLHRAPGEGESSFSEKAIYQQAWDHLIPEIAVVQDTDKESAGKKVVGLLEAA
ncbi:MAG: CarD family transcriptional regulator [Proteobacteria bacterium]|nr:CarD family transcriptional regulator [Pseudomonadota bacterium]